MCVGSTFEVPEGTALRPGRKSGESRGGVQSGVSADVLRSLTFNQFVAAAGGRDALSQQLGFRPRSRQSGPEKEITDRAFQRVFEDFQSDPERFSFLIGQSGPQTTGPGRFESREDPAQTGAGNLRFDELRIRR